jgi:hypothetical protein
MYGLRVLSSSGPKAYTRLVLLLSSTGFGASRGRRYFVLSCLERDSTRCTPSSCCFDSRPHPNLALLPRQQEQHQSTAVTKGVVYLLLHPDAISAFEE